MIALKNYQDRVLASLKAFFCQFNLDGRNFDCMVDEIAAGTFDWSGMELSGICTEDHAV